MGAALAKSPQRRFEGAERELMAAYLIGELESGRALAEICREPEAPAERTVWEWAETDPALASAIARARAIGFDRIALDCLTIADGLMTGVDAEGKPLQGDTQRDKLRVETRLKLLAKWDPKRYGEAFQLRHADADGEKLDTSPMVRELMGLMRRQDGSGAALIEGSATVVAPKEKGPQERS